MKTDFGTVGLGTMGGALLLNMLDHGFTVSGLDTSQEKVDKFLAAAPEGKALATTVMGDFVASIRPPRPILVLVPAGAPVDSVINGLVPLLEPGDFVIDGGNSHFRDTDRRIAYLKGHGEFGFMGMGVSGGEKGARKGPSMMPGGAPADYERVRPILEAIAARHNGNPCVARVGDGSSGHYVKMVHNGIEYAMMELIAEAVQTLNLTQNLSYPQIGELFAAWSKSDMGGYLVEITATVLDFVDPETGTPLVSVISDRAKGKGTGKWTSQDAFDLGVPIPAIDAAVTARAVSSFKDERVELERKWAMPSRPSVALSPETVRRALKAAFLLAYAQGLRQIKVASDDYRYGVDLPAVARIWRAGCIIRSELLDPVAAAIPALAERGDLLLDDAYMALVKEAAPALRDFVLAAATAGIPVPAFAASLSYLDGMRLGASSANVIQGLRDLFGAHTYERLDKPGAFHTEWQPELPSAPANEDGQTSPKKHSNE